MGKVELNAQLVRFGLISKARLGTPSQEFVDTLNRWAEELGQSIRFRLEGVGTHSVRGYITWAE